MLLLLGLSLSACSRADRDDDGDGGTAHPRIAVNEMFRIGDETAGDTIVFGDVDGLAVNTAGQLFVGDGSANCVLVFSPEGTYLGQIGGPGSGPGEFRSVSNVLIGRNDSIYVFDWRRNWLSVFAPDTWNYARHTVLAEDVAGLGSPSVIGITDGGPVILYADPIRTSTVDEDRFDVGVLADWAGTITNRTARLPGGEILAFVTPEGSLGIRFVPFGRKATFRFSASGRLYSGWNETIDIAISSFDGTAMDSIKRSHVPIRVPDAELAAIDNPEDFDSIHKVYPAYATFIVDDRDQVWLKGVDQGDSTVEWLVLDAAGSVVGQATLPEKLKLSTVQAGRAYGYYAPESVFDTDPVIPTVFAYAVDM